MTDFDNTNSGVLFKNEEKITLNKPNWPDYKGNLNVEGTELWISAWIKKSKGGKSFMSLSVTEKAFVEKKAPQQAPRANPNDQDPPPF